MPATKRTRRGHRSRVAVLGLVALLALVLAAVARLAEREAGGPSAPPEAPEPRAGEDVRYVSPEGSDDDPGTQDEPWETVEHALSEAEPGVRILLREGAYEEEVDVEVEGEEGRPVVLEAYPGERAVVNGQMDLVDARHVRVSGLVFEGEDTSGTAIRVTGGEDVEFSHNEVTGYQGSDSAQGFLITDGALRVRLVGNRIHDLGTWSEHDHGIYCRSSDEAYIANNLIYRLDQGAGIHLYDDDGEGCDDATIVANTIVDNQTSGIVVSRGADRNLIVGNVIAGHSDRDNRSYGYALRQGDGVGEDNVVRDNLGWDNAQDPDFACSSCEQEGNEEGDPRFRDPDEGDFRLGRGSAALGGLDPQDAPRRDFERAPRPQGGEADLGAYEAG